MGKFTIRISDRLFFTGDAGHSKELVKKRKNRLEGRPGIILEMRKIRDGKYWEACEAFRKGKTLGYSGEELKELQANIWRFENEMKGPLAAHDAVCSQLAEENEKIIAPLRNEIVEIVGKYIDELPGLRSAKTINEQTKFVDRGRKGEGDVLVRTVKDNFDAIGQIKTLLLGFKSQVRSMFNLSVEEIFATVKDFEEKINEIDPNATVTKEISHQEWVDLKEARLI